MPLETVLERLRTMLAAGTIRRIRQTLVASNLAEGALVAWKVSEEKLNGAFDFMFQQDPFSGHVVVRSTRHSDHGQRISPVDHAQDAGRHLDGRPLRSAHAAHRRYPFQAHAGEGNFCARRRPCAPQDHRAGRQGRRAGEDDQGRRGQSHRPRVGSPARPQARIDPR
ncbi:MAG: hypothetical protein WDN28_32995 [Chthoniobacter sp.]